MEPKDMPARDPLAEGWPAGYVNNFSAAVGPTMVRLVLAEFVKTEPQTRAVFWMDRAGAAQLVKLLTGLLAAPQEAQ